MTIQEFRKKLEKLTNEAMGADLEFLRIINALDMQKTMVFYRWVSEGESEEFKDKRYFEEQGGEER